MVTRQNRPDTVDDHGIEKLQQLLEDREQELEELRERIRDLESKGAEFLSAASHAIMNPLTIIQSYLEIVLSDLPDGLSAEQINFMETAHLFSRRMGRIIDDLVELAALETGAVELERTEFSLNDLVAEACSDPDPEAASRNIDLEVTAPCDHIRLSGDVSRVRNALCALVSNAVRLTPPGGRVEVRISRVDGNASVSVTDAGPGISDKDRQLLFEPFSRIQRLPGEAHGGAGLGLAVARRQIQAHGGQIEIVRSDHSGSTFRVMLPAARG